MKKLNLFLALAVFMLATATLSYAYPIAITLNAPTNGVNQTDTSTLFNWTVTGNYTSYKCEVFLNTTGTWTSSGLITTANNTATTYSKGLASAVTHKWNVRCSGAGQLNYSASNYTVNKVDTAVITINTANSKYFTGTQTLNFTVAGLGSKSCELYTDGVKNLTNATTGALVHTMTLADGSHTYYLKCNNSALVTTTSSTQTLYADSTAPTAIKCISPANVTIQSDNTPLLAWNQTTETNFANYTLVVSNSSTFAADVTYTAVTTKTTPNYTVTMNNDQQYYWYVQAHDKSGNYVNSSVCTKESPQWYKPKTWGCSSLHAGWNICGWTRDAAMNFSDIGTEIGSSVTQISKWNSSHEFQTYVVGVSTNAGTLINRGESAFIYASAAVDWSANTFTTNTTLGTFDFTNTSSDHWSVYPVLLPTGTGTFSENMTTGGNLTTCSFYNNSVSTYVPMWDGVATNNLSSLRFGDSLWCEKNTSISTWTLTRKI